MRQIIRFQLPLILAITLSGYLAFSQESKWDGPQPRIMEKLKHISYKFDHYETVLKPDKDQAEYWAGATIGSQRRKWDFLDGGTNAKS